MITIIERKATKLPQFTSLYIKLDEYNKNVFDFLVQSQNSVYNKTKNEFEFSITKLYFLVDYLTKYADVKFIPLHENTKPIIKCNSKKFKIKPFSHQLEAINYGLNKQGGWLLLDDCGLGKTISMIYLAEELSRVEKIKHCLIICGVNSLKYNWEAEINKFSSKSCTILGQKISKKTGKTSIGSVADRCKALKNKIDEFFVITNKETLQSKEFLKAFNSSKNTFDMIVLDEAHKCKDPSSLSGKNLLKLKANHTIALTGTIIMNNPENAYVPLKWTNNIGCNFTEFKKMFNVYGGFGGVQVIGYKNLDILQDLLSKCSLRRRKEDVLDLPDKVINIEYVEMKSQQQKLYNEVEEGILHELDKLDHIPTVAEEITINMRLRQITAYPGALSTEVTQSAKLERLVELIEEIVSQGDKVLVFNTFKSAVDREFEILKDFNPVVCTGSQSDEEIAELKKKFNDDDSCKVMIATWQKMGTGHTLNAANYAIFIDTPWTYADFQQACDRIYRIGQNKKVTIITLITKNTYDERVQELIDTKECLSEYLVDNQSDNSLTIIQE